MSIWNDRVEPKSNLERIEEIAQEHNIEFDYEKMSEYDNSCPHNRIFKIMNGMKDPMEDDDD